MAQSPAAGSLFQNRHIQGWNRSVSLGGRMEWTLNPRGSIAWVRRLMTVPLPEASQPSKTTITGTPAARASRWHSPNSCSRRGNCLS